MNTIENSYNANKSNQKIQSVLNSSLKSTKLVAKLLVFLYISAGFFFYVTPLATYYLKGELVPFLEIYVPGLDYKTIWGYIITNILQFIGILYAVFGNFIFDLMFFVFYYHIVTLNELMKITMEEIGEYLVENDLKIPENAEKVKDMMKEIYGQHRDMLKCVQLSQ
jgi:hypothetical protein